MTGKATDGGAAISKALDVLARQPQRSKPGLLGEVADSRTGAGNTQEEPAVSYGATQQGGAEAKTKTHDDESISNGHRSQMKQLPMAKAGTT